MIFDTHTGRFVGNRGFICVDTPPLGKLSASELIRALQRGSKRSLLARALGELGRIPKTLHLLTFIDDPCYRRGILTQLNRGEGRIGWHASASMASGGNSGSDIARVKKTNSVRWVW
jgi:TnpA family transposase